MRLAGALALVLCAGVLAPGLRAQAEIDPNAKPALDPFVVLIEKPKPKAPRVRPTVRPVARQQAPRIPPLQLKLQTIIGAGGEFIAVVEFKNQELILGNDWDGSEEEPAVTRFKVVEISEEKLVVYDNMAKARKTFRLADEPGVDGISFSGGGDDF